MRNFLIYTGVFVVAVVLLGLFTFDSMRLSIYFAPPVYIAFVLLLPINVRPIGVLLLGFATGVFVDFFEGTAGLHTAVTLFTALVRRPMMVLTLGRETVEESVVMPSVKSLGGKKFLRYAALAVGVHCLACFNLEALSGANYSLVLVKTLVSGVTTLATVWCVSLLFTVKTRKKL